MACDGQQEKRDTVAMVAKTCFFSSLKNRISETRGGKKIMLTTLTEKIKFKYKFLQFYQVLFISFHLNVQGCLTTGLVVKALVAFLSLQQVAQHAE